MQRNSSNIFLGTGVDQVEKVSLARFTVKHLLFPNLDQQTIDMLATRLGEIVKRKKPRYGPSSINPSSADVQILKEMFSDTHSKVTSSGISVAQAFGLLNTFERNIGNIATAEEAYAAIQCADEITTATKLVRSKKLGGIKSARNRRKSNQERNRRISLIAKKNATAR